MNYINHKGIRDAAYVHWLERDNGYTDVKLLSDGKRWAGLYQFMFTHAIIVGKLGDQTGYENRWCYADKSKALAALGAWNGKGEPTGWHRHPVSGRRRKGGDASTEYVDP